MSAEGENHGAPTETHRSFAQAAMEVLNWEREGFQGQAFETSKALGREEVQSTFAPEEGEPYDAEKLDSILRFLSSRMDSKDVGELQAMLDQRKGVRSISTPPRGANAEPAEVLKSVLSGTHDKSIEMSKIASRGDVYTVAFFLYLNTSSHSEVEMTEVLADLVPRYDDSEVSHYDVDADGIAIEPFLASLCKKAIERYGIQEGFRNRVKQTLELLPTEKQKAIGRGNVWSMGIDLKKSA